MSDGGPAFPQQYRVRCSSTIVEASGMTLRDYFAAAALSGLIGTVETEGHVEGLGEASYRAADIMLKARDQNTE